MESDGKNPTGLKYFNGSTKAVLDVTVKLLFVASSLVLGLVSFEGRHILAEVRANSAEIKEIKGNRYTSGDALNDMRLVNKSVIDLRTWIEDRYPPTWLKQDVDELKLEVRELRVQMMQRGMIEE